MHLPVIVKCHRGTPFFGKGRHNHRRGDGVSPTFGGHPDRWVMLVSLVLAGLCTPISATADSAEQVAATVCAACHGPDGNSTNPMFPKIAGHWPEYIVKQLSDFKQNKRVNEAMAPIIANLSDDDIRVLAAHYSRQKTAPGVVSDPALAEKGKQIYMEGNPDSGVPACKACHKPNGEGTQRFPHVAGQHTQYLITQLKAFASGARTNDKGRLMQKLASRMTEDEMKSVAEYITGLTGH